MDSEQPPTKTPDPWSEIGELHDRMGDSKDADPKDVKRLRQLAVETPAFLGTSVSITQSIREQLIEKIGYGATRAILLAEGDKLKQELGHAVSPPIEQLLIDHILTVRLRAIDAENRYNQAIVNQSVSLQMGVYWDNLLTSTQARFLKAIETLARVRRLARYTPSVQINIAREGAKQVNVQGETESAAKD